MTMKALEMTPESEERNKEMAILLIVSAISISVMMFLLFLSFCGGIDFNAHNNSIREKPEVVIIFR